MINAQAAAVKVFTDLTCWKCGEEALTEAAPPIATLTPRREKVVASELRHSDCQKCGAYSVNAAQARHNKVVGRHNRKAIIKEANRKLA